MVFGDFGSTDTHTHLLLFPLVILQVPALTNSTLSGSTPPPADPC